MTTSSERPDYDLQASPVDSWRNYNPFNPDPGYGEFDWLSSRYPDLYHKFALSTDGVMDELEELIDLTGKVVLDVGAGTGRSTMAAARKARAVLAVDPYYSVVDFGVQQIRSAGLRNVTYVYGHRSFLPVKDSSIDVVMSAWAVMDYKEAYRALRPGGHIVDMASAPSTVCGELTATLRPSNEQPPSEWFDLECPNRDGVADPSLWRGIPLRDGVHLHDFTYQTDWKDVQEAAAILGRLWGPAASKYMSERNQSSVNWRLRIEYGQVDK